MSDLNSVPSGERVHISFFGCRNAGKSSIVNLFTGQDLSIVSDTPGTTTDPVRKSMELLPLGPVTIIDTPGIDDTGDLGSLRAERGFDVLEKSDIAILVIASDTGVDQYDRDILQKIKEREIPYLIVFNKTDLLSNDEIPVKSDIKGEEDNILYVSAAQKKGIEELKIRTAELMKDAGRERPLIGDLVSEGDRIVLVVPIDKAAPKGRLILPQQQVIRDALDNGAIPIVCRDSELKEALDSVKAEPRMVITDSQVFKKVDEIVPEDIPLTSFSILMARYKGNFEPALKGVKAIDSLKEGDRVLISEGCTHHRQCGDIGSVKIPALLKKYTGHEINFDLSSGTEFPKDLSAYSLIIHCGACMLNKTEAVNRYRRACEQGVAITNYGIALSFMNGILDRCIQIFNI
ncbi:MAG: [Lachnospiraceae bacterium]|nr:[FeFe] hydrogenase H-cluster maturation GTPase HydF [Lachnospiraceae bacterium]